MDSQIDELAIVDKSGYSIFNGTTYYSIHLYQRAYSWTESQIEQLIDDINGLDDRVEKYYLGSLIVSKLNKCPESADNKRNYHFKPSQEEDNYFEVIDGQQRLTTLLLLLIFIKNDNLPKLKNTLSYECRQRAQKTFERLIEKESIPDEECDEAILDGYGVIKDKFEADKIDIDSFISKLAKLRLFRIQVPSGTDLNSYFEIMNTRGEQLEQHDILKARLMSHIDDEQYKTIFARIWDACSDMNGYVQMHFDTSTQKILFGDDWQLCGSNQLGSIINSSNDSAETCSVTLQEILDNDPNSNSKSDFDDEQRDYSEKAHFESIISFPYFLLHVLRVFTQVEKTELDVVNKQSNLIDDRNLLAEYDKVVNVIQNGTSSYEHYSNNSDSSGNPESTINTTDFPMDFIYCLLKCRFLFDKYIIKREYAGDSGESEWSLKELRTSKNGNSKNIYYVNTRLATDDTNIDSNTKDSNLIIQSALRVSYTSPKSMHWITDLLIWLYKNDSGQLDNFCEVTKEIARDAVKNYLSDSGRNSMGTATPRIVFNYLDYLLWEREKEKYKDFVFEFRNSVEHWYPQHPSEGTFEPCPSEILNSFGNLCLVTRSINSKFSNMSPDAKKTTFKEMIKKGSLKLRIMSEMTTTDNGWRKTSVKQHGDEMFKILEDDCGINSTNAS